MRRFYITTPIYYASDVPHLGHAYTTVVADALARYHRMRGDDTRFLTGTDDHGQKIERLAQAVGRPPKQFTDEVAAKYRVAWQTLHAAPDDFIRTTDADHEATVAELWRRMEQAGDIYLGHYEGWYCVACEQYYTEKELGPGPTCLVHQKPVEKVQEESYFFRLSAYQKRLTEFYARTLAETGRPFVEPQIRMNEVQAFVEAGLRDFSVSRTTFQWGIAVPGRPGHVVYVWIDALTNYYSATRRITSTGFWSDDVDIVHLIGKEISRFHAVYWPAMLMSAGLRPPSKIFAHGWWTVDGQKMSKTSGNVVDPCKLAADVGADAFRYFVLREVPLGLDGDFSHEALLNRYNSDLANDLGNLLNRTLGMVSKYFGDALPASGSRELAPAAERAVVATAAAMDTSAPSKALEAIWALVREGNAYIDRAAPWKAAPPRQAEILGNALEVCRFLGHLVGPFMPERAAALLTQLGVDEPPQLPRWSGRAYRVRPGEPLFPRIDADRRRELLARWVPKPTGADRPATPDVTFDEFSRLDLRVAEIVRAEPIPRKDKLLKLTVSLGDEQRQVVAGIATAYHPEELVGKRVLFLANLKPAQIGGVRSEGMILAAGEKDVLALSAVDRECAPGTKVR